MSYKPILFNTPMVQAILDGRKTCTRRVVKPQPTYELRKMTEGTHKGEWHEYSENPLCDPTWKSPWGAGYPAPIADVGDILWVRESAMIQSMKNIEKAVKLIFRADNKIEQFYISNEFYKKLLHYPNHQWLPPYYLTKEVARIFLRVTDMRVERLQDITEEDSVKEGAVRKPHYMKYGGEKCLAIHKRYINEFSALWNSTIPKKDLDLYGWDANPWVWVIEFERCEMPEDWRSNKNV